MDKEYLKQRLFQIFYQGIQLRLIISYAVRIESITENDIIHMKLACKKLFKSCCLFDTSISPSMWNLVNVAPAHALESFSSLGLGLGIHTMEGREQKHQQIQKYSSKATFQERWLFVFRHEFIQLIHLQENGFDLKKYNKKINAYLPEGTGNFGNCSLEMADNACIICDSDRMENIKKKIGIV